MAQNTSPRLTWEALTLQLINPFRLSYGVSNTRQAYWLRLANDEGWGEGTIPPYYGVEQSAMQSYWQSAAADPRPWPDEPAEIGAWLAPGGPAVARAALDLALHDRIGRQRGLPLYRLLGLPQPVPRPTSFTIAIDTPEEMARQALQIAYYPVIKIKLGSDDDEGRLAAIRAARPDATLRVDANAGWTRPQAFEFVQRLERYNLEMIEQPLEKGDLEGLGLVQQRTSIPIVADESVQTLADVETLARAGVQGINLKLMKAGGLAAGLKMLRRARELGMRVLLGCMIETSLGTTAMAHLSGLADWLDLDAPILISNDPFEGVTYDQRAVLTTPERPGIGAMMRG